MPSFGVKSRAELATLHPTLARVLEDAIQYVDFSIIEGHRGEQAQTLAVMRGNSRVRWPHGKHNSLPSLAVDVAPYPVDWSDDEDAVRRFAYLGGFIMCCARKMGVTLRWGADWDRDDDLRNEKGKLRDFPHFELVL